MEKVYGFSERDDKIIKFKGTDRAVVLWGYGVDNIDGEDVGYQYRKYFYTPKSSEEIIKYLCSFIDNLTDKKILTGFIWNDTPVYLSTENQFNFKAAYDLAVQTQGAILPITFKLGEDDNGTPQYYTFEDMATFSDFYTRAIAFIQQTLAEGWQEKDQARETFKDE